MMKKIFSIAIATIALMAVPTFAQNTASTQTQTEKTCDNNKVCGFGKKGQRMTPEQKQQCRAAREARLYEGMTLSDSQKQQISELNEKTRAERQAVKAQRQEARAQAKESKAQSKEARAAEKKAMKEKKIAARKEYLKEMKKIVGADNYVIFLENEFVVSSDHGNKAKAGIGNGQRRGDKGGKMFKNGKKGGKGTLAGNDRKRGNKDGVANGKRSARENSSRA